MTRVIGARELEQLAVGASLTVPEDAIITPLAMDIIREKRLRLEKVEAEADVASRIRAGELEAAEQVLNEALEPSSRTATEQDKATTLSERQEESRMAETPLASVVDATVKHALSQSLLDKVEAPDVVKFAVFGPDGVVLLRVVAEEVQRCGLQVERLSGRSVSGLFVLAAAVASPPAKRDEAKRSLERGLSSRQLPVVFET